MELPFDEKAQAALRAMKVEQDLRREVTRWFRNPWRQRFQQIPFGRRMKLVALGRTPL